ncbi:MAG: PilT/PilU family type 4a pilus ATPase [Planctomycetes bacterium]|nr:PilT/PilU family type 4a pilus ATPase [Planctomycetota bacterium]
MSKPEVERSRCPEAIRDWLTTAVEKDASDLHLVVGHPPVLRVHGLLQPLNEPLLDAQRMHDLLMPACPPPFREQFLRDKNADFALEVALRGQLQRFRANYFFNGEKLGACFRVIPSTIPDFRWANFPASLAERLTGFRNGLVLVAGVTGSGKTTSLAMLINKMNLAGGYRIITIEEPVEYLFPRVPTSVVTQREVGVDVATFADGLKYGLRQDPDVILVGEIRDRQTAQIALSAAETGHLVFSTLHTRDAKGAISRFVDLFPQTVQHEIRAQLAMSLRAVISQHLLPSNLPGSKRELAVEIMFTNSPIASAIRFAKIESIDNTILTGRAEGMITLDESVRRLLVDGKIDRAVAEWFVTDVSVLDRRR